jgi:hypothetical protein
MSSIIKSTSVRRAEPGEAHPTPAHPLKSGAGRSGGRCRKEVELLREGDLVRAIQFKCSCGDTTVVELSYPEAPEAAE